MNAPSEPIASSISLRSVGAVSALAFGQLALLFVLQLVLADAFGASAELDAYLAAYAIPLTVGGIVSGAAASALVPLYSRRKLADGVHAAEAEAACVLLALAAVSTAASLALTFGADFVATTLYPELATSTTPDADVASLTAILAWLMPSSAIIGALYGLEHARGSFLLPAASGIAGPIVTIAGFLFASDRSIEALAWATVAGGAVGVACLGFRLPRFGGALHGSSWAVMTPLATLGFPLLLGAAAYRLDAIVDRPLAAALSEGSISQLGYSWRIIAAAASIATTGLSVVIFPSLARHAAAHDDARLRRDLDEGWKLLALVTLPIAAGIWRCGERIVAVCFERGEFTSGDTERVAALLTIYLGALVAAGVSELATRTFHAFGRMWLPTLVGVGGFALGAVLKVAVVGRFGADGIAAATSAYYAINAVILVVALAIPCSARSLLATLLRTGVATFAAVGAAEWLMRSGGAWTVPAGIALAAGLYAAILYATGDEFARRGVAAALAAIIRGDRSA